MNSERGISVRGLRKRYGRIDALAGVDFQVPRGGTALLVGPNGAGKTTLLKVLMDLLPYEEGAVEVLGMEPDRDGARIRAAAGFLPEEIHFPFERLRVREVLDLHSRFRPTWDPEYARRLERELELKMEQPWGKLSKGESRRVQLACALAARPALLLLDEPTDGLDPLGRELVLGLLAEHLAATGATTVYCTHVLHEAQGLPDRLIVLGEGRIRLDEDVATLRETHLRIRFSARDGAPDSAPFLIRDESRERPERSWVVRAGEDEVRAWAATNGLSINDMGPVSLGDTALAYLAAGRAPVRTPINSAAGLEDDHV
jgi:ABC-2 type transport system ATP-binding protein